MSNLRQGVAVIVWARPRTDVILLLGEGFYEGDNYINGALFPVVKLLDGREVTVHQQGIAVGDKNDVAKTCKAFKGVVRQFDIADYLNGQRPPMEELTAQLATRTASNPMESLPEPKTLTDKLMHLKREVEYEESKKVAAQAVIDAANKVIAGKKAEMGSLKAAVQKELDAIDDVPAVVLAPQEVKPVPVVARVEVPVTIDTDEEARKNALED